MILYDLGLPLALVVWFAVSSGYFSLMGTSVAESHRSRLEKLSDEGSADAQAVIKILDEPDKLINTAQAGFTLSSTLAGLLSALLAPYILTVISGIRFDWFIAVVIAFTIATAIVLTVGMFIPKAVARHNPEKCLLDHYKGFNRTATLLTPVTFVLDKITGLTMMLYGSNAQDDAVTEDEVKDLIEQGTADGTIETEEKDMVGRVFQLGDETAYSLMTPRTQMVWIDLNDSLEHNLKVVRDNPGTIIPVGEGSLDDCRGLLHAKDLLDAALADDGVDKIAHQSIKLDELLHAPMYVPSSMDTFRLLEKFKNTRVHEAMVLDEFGGVVGFITLDDILSEVIGASGDGEAETAQFSSINKNSWFVDGLYDVDDFKKYFHIDELPDEERDHFQTMGGFITSYFGYIPKVGESFVWNELKFEVARMDRARVDKILVTRVESAVEK
ncbi:MAG: HlyC/CorC family transporter [Selenomonadaceae bacterium]|nr:HlyC/CorC family transporter [Selenomonadaceae bacterium]